MAMNSANPTPRSSGPRALALVGSLSAAALVLPAVASAQVSIFADDFATNSLSSYTNPSGGRTAFTHNSGSEWLNVVNNNATYAATRTATVGSFEDFSSFTVAADFRTNTSLSNTGGINMAAVGMSTTAADFFGSFTGIEVTVRATGTSAFLRLRDGAGTDLTSGTAFSLAANTWYTLSLTLTATEVANTFLASASVVRVSDQVVISSFTAQSISLTLEESADLFAGLAGSRNDNRGSVAMDNFAITAIPEPSNAAALFGVMALASVGLRRRRRAA